MKRIPVILIFDIGKTNKKVLLFDENYKPVYEESTKFDEIYDEDGFPCEDVFALTEWVKESFDRLMSDIKFEVRGVNFTAYGASFVYLDEQFKVIPPLSNYLKPFPPAIQQKFYADYGGQNGMAKQTASPVLGNLNSGMQLYRLKYSKPDLFQKIKHALHLPQYLSFILTKALHSDITSVGCHTHLWDFQQHNYHRWVAQEGVLEKLAPLLPGDAVAGYADQTIPVGAGLHDSSAALIPYFSSFSEPFILISTGTWCISLNPFNHTPLTDAELKQDCLCYLSYEGKPVKASRLFAGHEHEKQVVRLAAHFGKPVAYYTSIGFDAEILHHLKAGNTPGGTNQPMEESAFQHRDLHSFKTYEAAYHQLMADIIHQQVRSTKLVLKEAPVKRIFVDGGFSKNPVYMNLLAKAFPQTTVYAASVAQASAIGAALAIHEHWNTALMRDNMIELQLYPVSQDKSGVF